MYFLVEKSVYKKIDYVFLFVVSKTVGDLQNGNLKKITKIFYFFKINNSELY